MSLPAQSWQYAEPPRFELDVSYSLPVGGQSHNPNDSTELNTLLTGGTLDGKTLARGDVITLDAGTTYTSAGSGFQIPALGGSGWVYVISSALGSLPAYGTRVSPADATNMPRIQAKDSSDGHPAITVTTGSKYFRFVGIEFRGIQSGANFTYNVVQLGNGATVEDDLAQYIYFDRCYIHGSSTIRGDRGVAMNGKNCAVIHSYVSDFHATASDTQAIALWDGVGGHLILNNYLEGAGENFICGGATPSNLAWLPSDMTIRGNHIYKPLAWDGVWESKNHLELKYCQRVLIEKNVFENFWEDAQDRSFNIAEINQSGPHTNAQVNDVTVRWNKWKNITSWMTTCYGPDCAGTGYTSAGGRRLLVENNLIDGIRVESPYLGYGQPVRIGKRGREIYIRHNTAIFKGTGQANAAVEATGISNPGDGIYIDNNLWWNGQYGTIGDGGYTFEQYWDNWSHANNVMVGGSSAYGTGNFFPANEAAVGFVGGGDYTLSGGSSYKNAGTDGLDVGCTNVALVESYATAAINGTAS